MTSWMLLLFAAMSSLMGGVLLIVGVVSVFNDYKIFKMLIAMCSNRFPLVWIQYRQTTDLLPATHTPFGEWTVRFRGDCWILKAKGQAVQAYEDERVARWVPWDGNRRTIVPDSAFEQAIVDRL